jgi:putative endonuclease
MTQARKELGDSGETLATQFLLREGYQILARNLKNRYGEVDILAQQGRTLVIVEVKTKSNNHYGQAAEMITLAKQKKLRLLAQVVAAHYQATDYRIDVIAIDKTAQPPLQHFIAAV